MRYLILYLTAILLWTPARAMGRRPPQETQATEKTANLMVEDVSPSEWRGQRCAKTEPSEKIITISEEWEDLWKTVLSAPSPKVDFDRVFAVAVFLGTRPTGGYGVEFVAPVVDARSVNIAYKVRNPAPGSFVTQAITQPYAVKLYRKTGLKISVSKQP